MKVLKKGIVYSGHYVGKCNECNTILEYNEIELDSKYTKRLNFYFIGCNECGCDQCLKLVPKESKEGKKIMEEV